MHVESYEIESCSLLLEFVKGEMKLPMVQIPPQVNHEQVCL